MYIGIMYIGFNMSFLEIPKTRFVKLLTDSTPQKNKKSIFSLKKIYMVLWCKIWQYLKPPSSLPLSFNFIYCIQYIWDFSNSSNLVLMMSHELLSNLLRLFCEGDIHLSSVEMGHILSTGSITLSSFWRVKEYLSPVPSPCFWESTLVGR